MRIVLAILFLLVGVAALVVYSGTPHGGPTVSCGPIHAFGYTATIKADCRYVSAGEIAAAVVALLIAALSAISARPGR
ncbi:MAG TPA: hypothetical protein VF898_11200 [Chloroflexota bacterium]